VEGVEEGFLDSDERKWVSFCFIMGNGMRGWCARDEEREVERYFVICPSFNNVAFI